MNNTKAHKERKRKSYNKNPEVHKAREKIKYANNPKTKLLSTKLYYSKNTNIISTTRKARYFLTEKNNFAQTFKEMHSNLEQDKTASTFLVQAYVKLHPELAKKVSNKGLCRAATRNATRCLLNIAKELRKEIVDCLLKCVRKIMHIQIDREEDFGEPHHTVHSEPFFYDASYCKVSSNTSK